MTGQQLDTMRNELLSTGRYIVTPSTAERGYISSNAGYVRQVKTKFGNGLALHYPNADFAESKKQHHVKFIIDIKSWDKE